MNVVALNAESGALLHTYPINLNTSPSAMAIENNMLYVAGQSDMCAINLNSGAEVWHQTISQTQVLGMLHVVNGTIYTTLSDDTYNAYTTLSSTSYVEAYNAKDGKRLWSSNPINSAISEVTVANGVVYNGTSDGVVYDGTSDGFVSAYDARTGTLLWSKSLNEGSFNGFAPLVDANNVYVGITPATSQSTMGLLALNKRNGNVQWQYPAEQDIEHNGHVFDTPVLQNGTIYAQVEGIGNNPNEVYAIRTNGSVVWHNAIQ
jgi:glucose dehydrogenase